ncbi:MAG: transcriptional repressor [Alicyclobacillus sp.]|nr:transcriptional repressor [Alicyclobacillus sp.]
MDKSHMVRLLHQQNFRLTREREALLDLLVRTDKMFTPAQWHEMARQAHVRVGLTTVYRLLEILTKVGLASPFLVDGSVYYAFCAGHHHHHFICLSCHRVQNLYECPAFPALPDGFEVKEHRLDLFGTCPACRAVILPDTPTTSKDHSSPTPPGQSLPPPASSSGC